MVLKGKTHPKDMLKVTMPGEGSNAPNGCVLVLEPSRAAR
jgi:hypothetical protein